MAIQEQSVYYQQFEAEREAFLRQRRARRIDPDLVPRRVLEALKPTWRHWEKIPFEEARTLESSEQVKLFMEGRKGWEPVPHLRRREPGQKVLAFRHVPLTWRLYLAGSTPKPKATPRPRPATYVSPDPPPRPLVSLTWPDRQRIDLDDRRLAPAYVRSRRILHEIAEGETFEDIARRYHGEVSPAECLVGYPRLPRHPGARVEVRVGKVLVTRGGAIDTDSVVLEWTGPTSGQETLPVYSQGWEYDLPVEPGTYTLTVSAGESRATRTVQVVRSGQEGVAVRVGVFFDGTGNNRDNDIPRGTDTNIARLYELYHVNPGAETTKPVGKMNGMDLFTQRFYQRGIGTQTGTENDDLEMGTGAGGVSRIEGALRDLESFLASFVNRKGPRIVDVFGFSRGAALARDFVNRVNERFARQGVQVGFVGLYDTVSSFGLAGNDVDIRSDAPLATPLLSPAAAALAGTFNLNLGLASAVKVVHLVAKHEYRANFALQSLHPGPGKPLPGNVEEIAVPGAHADVGGGYGTRVMEELHKVERREIAYRKVGPRARWQADLTRRKAALEAEAAALDAELLYDRTRTNAIGEATDHFWLARRRYVKPGLANVYLHVMYREATALDVPFVDEESLQNLIQTQPERFAITDDLKRLFRPDLVTPRHELGPINDYIHRSDVDWKNAKSITTWLANRGNDERVREVFWNDPDEAVVPQRPARRKMHT